jgi:RNA polymerase sigma-70 factor (ECF subfamily)
VTRAAEESDEALARRAAGSKDRVAFDLLVFRHKEPLYRFIRRYVGNNEDAYDLLQDAFLSAWMNLNRYDAGRPFLPWLRTIALNKCRDFSRRQMVRRLFLGRLAAESVLDQAASDETRTDQRLDQLDRAIAELPPFYKEPLLLTVVSGISQQEAAELLKTTPKAIEMRLRRARKKLAQSLPPGEG